jgi:hypothetical protein
MMRAMRGPALAALRCFVVAAMTGWAPSLLALEGTTAAGPVGGTDIRSALLPPPGLYGAVVGLAGPAWGINDGQGNPIPAFEAVRFAKVVGAGAVLYVPDVQIAGGSLGFFGVLPVGQTCGRLFAIQSWECARGFGDPYIELSWSRFFGRPRPSRDPGAFPILEGLAISFGLGAVLPAGQYDVKLATSHAITAGNNTFDIAPSFAFTFTTPPLIGEGTEVSAKTYLNNYATNPETRYLAGTLLNVDFAISERFGRFQAGLAGFYATQVIDDKLNALRVEPDGRRAELLMLGPVVNYDMPEIGAAVKVKVVQSVVVKNTVNNYVGVLSFVKKLY